VSFLELMQFGNLAILPALYYIIRLERRIIKLEVMLAIQMGLKTDG